MKSRYWIGTMNNPITSPSFDDTKMLYMVYQKERGESGTHHYQIYVQLPSARALSTMRNLIPDTHWEIQRGTNEQARQYCMKEDTRLEDPIEYGEFKPSGGKQGKRTDLEDVIEMVKQKRPREEYAFTPTYVKYYRGLEAIRLIAIPPYEHNDIRGEWYYGPSGTGKSRKAFEENPGAFRKAQNKWFDGYDNQDVIIIDDLDTATLGHHLKIWADRYPCTGEIKCGTVQLTHKKIIVTSNWSIEELFKDDPKMIEPLKRRFKEILFYKPLEFINQPLNPLSPNYCIKNI
ncbi:hypothetical protein [Shewanella sp.]|uniref:hypothetical protein n=1 Tax=Shewanella sp. TaxID=50422 RepID=UPI004047BFBE